MPHRLTTAEFIEKAKAVHGDRYDYSHTEYVRTHDPVTITCSDHGLFIRRPSGHLRGNGCPDCGNVTIAQKLRSTKANFLEKAKEAHGGRYDYSQVEYVNSQSKVSIVCPDHGSFLQVPNSHLQGNGCPLCGNLAIALRLRRTKADFLEEAMGVHGECYDYSQVEYVDTKTKVTIICPEHGAFAQRPDNHIFLGHGCNECGGNKPLTTETFVERARKVHGGRYDYSQVEYVRTHDPVTIICPDHGPFPQAPVRHISDQGCPRCGGTKPLTTEMFLDRAKSIHGDRYDYSQVKYVNRKTAVTIICSDHGSFQQTPENHLDGKNCIDCAGLRPLTTETFIERAKTAHGDRYDYSQVEYVNLRTDVLIVCPDHGPFSQSPSSHLHGGAGCSDCAVTGFNPSEPGLLYYLAITTDEGDTRYKIGITNNTVRARFNLNKDFDRIRIIRTWQYAIGRAAAEREAEILKQYAGEKYYGPDILIGAGNTELFTHDVLGLDK